MENKQNNAEAIESLVKDGWYIEDIAEALSLTTKYVTWVIGQYDLWEFAKHKPKEDRIKKSYATRMIKKEKSRFQQEVFVSECETMTARDLAEKYSCTENTIWYYCRKFDCKPKRSTNKYRKEINIDYVKECLALGITMQEVGELVGVAPHTIYTRLREGGLTVDDIIRKNPHATAQHTGHNCNPKAKRHDCIYWDHGCRCCDYLGKTGNRRPCPAWDCTVYQKGGRTKDKSNNNDLF